MNISKKKDKIKNLDELADESGDCFVLFDTSAIMAPLGKDMRSLSSLNRKTDLAIKCKEFYGSLRKYIEKGASFFITNLVLHELESGKHYNYKKMVKRDNSGNRNLLNLRRAIFANQKEKWKLIDSFKDNGRVIDVLNDDVVEIYNYFKDKYNGIDEFRGLSKVDLDMGLVSLSLAKSEGKSVIVSNDYGLLDARNDFIRYGDLSDENLGFFTRPDFFKFEQKPFKSLYKSELILSD